ncbi:hypothetical protein JKF63_07723 [Porcisia hertigi]|uniref:Uncharacterized protein n=1 Tax=Porcisia hertigi TaxID=2761500 RepID=A0A836LM08_9TRYP|nr:hypothetical protein JKF63_07723 [Porcisia hertigi]
MHMISTPIDVRRCRLFRPKLDRILLLPHQIRGCRGPLVAAAVSPGYCVAPCATTHR